MEIEKGIPTPDRTKGNAAPLSVQPVRATGIHSFKCRNPVFHLIQSGAQFGVVLPKARRCFCGTVCGQDDLSDGISFNMRTGFC